MKPSIQNIDDIRESKELYDKSPNKIYIFFIYVFLIFLIFLVIWLFYGEIEIVSKGKGIIETNENISTLKSKVSGEIEVWNLEEGKYVEKGDILLKIKTDNLEIKKEQLENQIFDVENEIMLLNKFIKSIEDNKNLFIESNDLEKEYYYKYLEYEEQYNIAILNSRQYLESENLKENKITLNKEYYKEEIERIKLELDDLNDYLESVKLKQNVFKNKDSKYLLDFSSFNAKILGIEKNIKDQEKEYKNSEMLFNQGAISENELEQTKIQLEDKNKQLYLEIKNKELEIENNIKTLNNTLSKYINENDNLITNDDIIQINNNMNQVKINNFKTSNIVSTYNKIGEKELLLESYNKELESINISINEYSIKSPINGVLNLVGKYNTGDFINMDIAICTIVPKNDNIYNVRITIPNQEIGKVKVNDNIEYRIDALPYKEYGKFKGKVKVISSNSIIYDNGASSYIINGSIESKEIYNYKGVPSELKIGMSCDVSIITDKKKIIYYLLEKLNIKK